MHLQVFAFSLCKGSNFSRSTCISFDRAAMLSAGPTSPKLARFSVKAVDCCTMDILIFLIAPLHPDLV